MKRIIAILLILLIWSLSIGAERYEPMDFEAAGFQQIYTTAYCVGHHTANGDAVYEGGCACSPDHIGDVAVIFSMEGEFLGYFFCNDTGKAGGGVRAGNVVDIYRTDYDRCVAWMTQNPTGKCWIRWIEGEG